MGPEVRKVGSLISATLQFIYFTPTRALRTQLGGLRSLLRASGVAAQTVLEIPKDPHTASTMLDLQPVTNEYVVCPTCHALYPYSPHYTPRLEHCTYLQTPSSQSCQAPLWKTIERLPGEPIPVPIKKYLHQDLKAWLGRLLARKNMEDILDSRPHIPLDDPNAGIDDIWLSKLFLDLKDPSGEPFYPGTNGEGRLVFGLSVDSFNPFHNKTAKQSVSSTGIWLVLLNLPPELRYLHENIYVAGVIPGHPSLDQINRYLDLLIDELMTLWEPGVFFSRTTKYNLGRLYRALIIPLICDMLAARQVLGQAAATSHNCCTLCDIDLQDIDIVDAGEWPEKDWNHMRECAIKWRDAASETEQDMYFRAYGIRWSALLRLPYWDATKYAVVDSMHTIDLLLLSHQCRQLFGIDTAKIGGDGTSSIRHVGPSKVVTTKKDIGLLKTCSTLVHANPEDLPVALLRFGRRVLYTFCLDYNIIGMGHTVIIGTRYVLSKNIVDWVSVAFF